MTKWVTNRHHEHANIKQQLTCLVRLHLKDIQFLLKCLKSVTLTFYYRADDERRNPASLSSLLFCTSSVTHMVACDGVMVVTFLYIFILVSQCNLNGKGAKTCVHIRVSPSK